MRKRIFEIIEIAGEGDRLSNIYDSTMMIMIIVSLLPLCTKSTALWTVVVDAVTVCIFIFDYILRFITADYKFPDNRHPFIKYPFSFFAVIDLLTIIPSFGILSSGFKILKVFRLFRTLRVFRTLKMVKAFKVLKILRYTKSIQLIGEVIKAQKEALITVSGLAIGYILVAALIIFNVEPESFTNFFEAIYWACVSLTTVGYGDIYPTSTAGRIVTMLSSLVGIAIVALPSGIITAGYMEAIQKENAKSQE